MEQKLIKCQNLEALETCNTRSYLRRVKDTCGCVPFKIKYHISEEYTFTIKFPLKVYFYKHLIKSSKIRALRGHLEIKKCEMVNG